MKLKVVVKLVVMGIEMSREEIDVWSYRDLDGASDEELSKWIAGLPIEEEDRDQLRTEMAVGEEKADASEDGKI